MDRTAFSTRRFPAVLLDDGLNGDTRANDDIYTNAAGYYGAAVAKEDDTGPRILRMQAEIETPDGLRHATAVEFGTVTVVGGA